METQIQFRRIDAYALKRFKTSCRRNLKAKQEVHHMINMSYCQFENTLGALQEIRERVGESYGSFDDLNESEQAALIRLVPLMREIAQELAECYSLEELIED